VLTALWVGLVLPWPAARAQSRRLPKTPASEAFGLCREQDKVGDASACWKVWLSKWREIGSEAEVAYAEEHASSKKVEPVPEPAAPPVVVEKQLQVVRVSGPPNTAVEVDGRPVGVVPLELNDLAPGEHAVTFTLDKKQGRRSIDVKSGQTLDVALAFESAPTSAEPSKPASTSEGVGAPLAKGDVLDFCALKPSADTGKFQKQRLILFGVANASQLEQDPDVAKVDAGHLFRDTFVARFPLPRFHNVLVGSPGRVGWESAESIPVSEVETLLSAKPDLPGTAGERAEREQKFATYSLGCTDYVAFPSMTSHEVKWEEKKIKTKNGEKTVRMLTIKVEGALGIFRREGAVLKKVATVTASVPGIADSLSDAAAMTAAAATNVQVGGVDALTMVNTASELPKHVSGVPDPTCLKERVGTEGSSALASCLGKGEGTAEQALGGIDERMGAVCRKAMSSGEPDLIVKCEVRARAFQLSRALQKEARSVPGWKLFGTAALRGNALGVNLGAEEGVKVGYAFELKSAAGTRLGFLKVTSVGAGGEKATAEPSSLNVRSGDIPDGARIEEYPQLGIVAVPYVSFATLAYSYGPTVFADGSRFRVHEPPAVVFGGGLTAGYDLSSLLSWSETFFRVGGAYYIGSGRAMSTTHIPIEAFVEKGFYLGRRLGMYIAPGGVFQLNQVKLEDPQQPFELSSTTIGAAGRLGFDILLHPDWSLRVEGIARVPITQGTYEEKDGKVIPAEVLRREDHFATIGANLGVAKTF
jgi:hypothetical protein